MSSFKIETDENGCEMVVMTDPAKYGSGPKGIPVANILIRACDGAVFNASPGLRGLSRLGEPEAAMVEYYLSETGAVHEPVVFAGDTPPDG